MRFVPLLAILLLGACSTGSAHGQAETSTAPAPAAPLEGLAAKSVLVLPAQYVSFADTLGWSAAMPSTDAYLAAVDSALTAAFRERGLQSWRYAEYVTHLAKRNEGFVANPHGVAAITLREGRRAPREGLGEPLASQLRSLIALSDARVVLIPVELRSINTGGQGQLALRIAIIDARGSKVLWLHDIVGAPASAWSPALLTDLADRVGELIVPAN
jgi:hypothetical protein